MSQRDEPQRPLPYEGSGSTPTLISRGQFRWLLILLTIHLLITVQNTYAPGLRFAVREWWGERQQKAAREAALKQALVLEQQAMKFSEPASKVVWEEDPDEAAKLMAGGGYRWIQDDSNRSSSLRSLALPKGALSLPPPIYGQAAEFEQWAGRVDTDTTALVFLHGLRSPAGNERLVLVSVSGGLSMAESSSGLFGGSNPPPTNESWTRPLEKSHRIAATRVVPRRGEDPAKPLWARATQIIISSDITPTTASWVFIPGAGGAPGQIKLEQRNRLRVFAGQPDPADPSRFTIAYDVDGTPGVLTGRLKDDDTIELRPSTGKLVGDRWYPTTK
jgi:hypothetical protein